MSFSDFDYESELTELSSSEDDETFVIPKGIKRKVAPKFELSQALRPPRTSHFSVKALYDQILDSTIDLDPEYQRDVVWPESKQVGLIDSILHNYYIPPIIFAYSQSRDGEQKRVCIDGKQRLTSIQRFMDGLIAHKDSKSNTKLWYKNGPGKKALPEQFKRLFASKQLVCVEYDDLHDDQEREIFQRVQNGVALTPAERLQALSGPLPNLIRDVLTEIRDGFDGFLNWSQTRGRDFHCVSTTCYLLQSNIGRWPVHTQIEKHLQTTKVVPNELREQLLRSFRIFVRIARDKTLSKPLKSPSRVSPIEFVMVAVLISFHGKSLSLSQLSDAIAHMRKDVRSKFDDIRMNQRVTKHMAKFIKKLDAPESRKDEIPADLVVGVDSVDGSSSSSTAQKVKKRKRTDESEDEESEMDVELPPTKTPAKSRLGATPSASSPSVAKKSAWTKPVSNPVKRTIIPTEMMPPSSSSKAKIQKSSLSTSAKNATSSSRPAPASKSSRPNPKGAVAEATARILTKNSASTSPTDSRAAIPAPRITIPSQTSSAATGPQSVVAEKRKPLPVPPRRALSAATGADGQAQGLVQVPLPITPSVAASSDMSLGSSSATQPPASVQASPLILPVPAQPIPSPVETRPPPVDRLAPLRQAKAKAATASSSGSSSGEVNVLGDKHGTLRDSTLSTAAVASAAPAMGAAASSTVAAVDAAAQTISRIATVDSPMMDLMVSKSEAQAPSPSLPAVVDTQLPSSAQQPPSGSIKSTITFDPRNPTTHSPVPLAGTSQFVANFEQGGVQNGTLVSGTGGLPPKPSPMIPPLPTPSSSALAQPAQGNWNFNRSSAPGLSMQRRQSDPNAMDYAPDGGGTGDVSTPNAAPNGSSSSSSATATNAANATHEPPPPAAHHAPPIASLPNPLGDGSEDVKPKIEEVDDIPPRRSSASSYSRPSYPPDSSPLTRSPFSGGNGRPHRLPERRSEFYERERDHEYDRARESYRRRASYSRSPSPQFGREGFSHSASASRRDYGNDSYPGSRAEWEDRFHHRRRRESYERDYDYRRERDEGGRRYERRESRG